MKQTDINNIRVALDALINAAFRTSPPDAKDKQLWCELASAAKLSLIELADNSQTIKDHLLRALAHCGCDEDEE